MKKYNISLKATKINLSFAIIAKTIRKKMLYEINISYNIHKGKVGTK